MAAETGERTEPATPRRRNEARAKGQVVRSHDLTVAIELLAAILALNLLGPRLWQSLLSMVRSGLTLSPDAKLEDVLPLALVLATETGRQLAPFLVILFLVMLIVLLLQVGPLFTWQPLMPSLSKLNPLAGVRRLFSVRSFVTLLGNIGKLVVVALVAYLVLKDGSTAILYAFTLGLQELLLLASSLTFRLVMWILLALIVLAMADYAWQRYRHERDLRMTKEEVKDELRSMEGDPGIKRRRRQLQFQMALKRLKKEVPKADVVVTNPTHLAVAICYDAETMPAPKVVAKGADHLALRIRQIAVESGVPIVERKPLARALYESVEVGQCIPERFYQTIAEILAYVYELTGRSPVAARRELAGV